MPAMKSISIPLKTLLILIFFCSSGYSQDDWQREKGLIKAKQETTYWDKDSLTIRSVGYYNNSGFSNVGQRVGEWKFYDKDGNLEEVTRYYMGLKHGQTVFFHKNGRIKIQAFFFLGVPDSVFKAYYSNGQLAEKGAYKGLPASFLSDTTNHMDWKIKLNDFSASKVGIWNYYYEDGTPFQVSLFKENDTTEYLMAYFNEDAKQLIKNGKGKIDSYYFSGKQKASKSYSDGLADGEYKAWNANGSLRVSGQYAAGKKDGTWKERYFVEDQDFQIYEYSKGLKHGKFIEYLVDGTKVIQGTYNQGLKEGEWEYFFENGSLDMKGNFKNGEQDSTWHFWYPNGQLYYKGDFKIGLKTGSWSFYYNDGSIWKKGSYVDNKKNGEWVSKYENGNTAFIGAYQQDFEDGLWSSFYENGTPKDKGHYKLGAMNKEWSGWYPNNQKRYEGEYENDLKTGSWKYWTDQGKLKDEENYKILPFSASSSKRELFKSYKHGSFKSYDNVQGKLVSEGNYAKSKQDGIWKYYYPGGEITNKVMSYSQGFLDGTCKEYDRRGNLKSEINYKGNKKHGNMKVYTKRGKLILHVVYKEGVKTKDVLKKMEYKYSKPKD